LDPALFDPAANLQSQRTWTSVAATNAVSSDSFSRTRRKTACPRKGTYERGGPGAEQVAKQRAHNPAPVSFSRRNSRGPQTVCRRR